MKSEENLPFDKSQTFGIIISSFSPSALASLLPFPPYTSPSQIPLAFLSKVVQNPHTSHHVLFCHPGPSHHRPSPGVLQSFLGFLLLLSLPLYL